MNGNSLDRIPGDRFLHSPGPTHIRRRAQCHAPPADGPRRSASRAAHRRVRDRPAARAANRARRRLHVHLEWPRRVGGDHGKPARTRTGRADSGQRTFLRAVALQAKATRATHDRHTLPRRLSDRPERRRTGAARRQEARDRRSFRRAYRHREQRYLRPASDPRGDRRRRPPGAVRGRRRRLACGGAVRDGCARRQRRGRCLARKD